MPVTGLAEGPASRLTEHGDVGNEGGHTPMDPSNIHCADATDHAAGLSTSEPVTARFPKVTTATEILHAGAVDTDHQAWLDVRRKGLGGSEVAAVLGVHPYHSPWQVWLDKTGRGRDTRDEYVMRRGRYYEPALVQWFADQTGLSTVRTGTWARNDDPWMRCNPDRFTSDGCGLEVKMPASEWAAQWKDGPAYYAVVQALWGAWVCGLPAWYLAADVHQGRGPELPCWVLDADAWAERIAYWIEYTDWWWDRYVVRDIPPPIDGSEAEGEALNWAYRAPPPDYGLGHLVRIPGLRARVDERARLKTVIKDAEGEIRLVENWIKAALQYDETGCDADDPTDQPIIAWRPVGTDPLDPTLPAQRAMKEIKPPKAKAPRASRKRTNTP